MAIPVTTNGKPLIKSHGNTTNAEKWFIRNAIIADLFSCGRGVQRVQADAERQDAETEVRTLVHNANFSVIKLAQLIASSRTDHLVISKYLDKEMISNLLREGEKVVRESDAALHLLSDSGLLVGMTKQLDCDKFSFDERIDLILQAIYQELR